MNMFTKIIKSITDGLTKYKQQRVQATVDAYAQTITSHAVKIMPLHAQFIADVTNIIVAKTYEDPKPLTDFLAAAQGLIDHYGTDITAAATQGYARVEAVMDKLEHTPEFVTMTEAIEAMLVDTTDSNIDPAAIAAAAAAAAADPTN